MTERVTLSETWQPEGFVLRVEKVETPDWGVGAISGEGAQEFASEMQAVLDRAPAFMEMESCYTLAGDYIGNVKWARKICGEYGVAPEKANPAHGTCSIGFSAKDQKWYGWSHRAIHGFGIGDHVKKGDLAYVPVDMDDFERSAADFWRENEHIDISSKQTVDADGRPCVEVSWTVGDVPNKAIVGERHSSTMYPPSLKGRGEWTAQTLDDAKEMAIAFADSVG